MWRPVCVLILLLVLFAGLLLGAHAICRAAHPDGRETVSAPDSIASKCGDRCPCGEDCRCGASCSCTRGTKIHAVSRDDCEAGSLGLNWRQSKGNDSCPNGQCRNGQCRHDEQKIQVEVVQPDKHAENSISDSHPFVVPLLVLAIVFIAGGVMYYAGWFTH